MNSRALPFNKLEAVLCQRPSDLLWPRAYGVRVHHSPAPGFPLLPEQPTCLRPGLVLCPAWVSCAPHRDPPSLLATPSLSSWLLIFHLACNSFFFAHLSICLVLYPCKLRDLSNETPCTPVYAEHLEQEWPHCWQSTLALKSAGDSTWFRLDWILSVWNKCLVVEMDSNALPPFP